MLSLMALAVLTCSPNLIGAIADKDLAGPGVTLRQRASTKAPRVFTIDLIDATGKVLWKQRPFSALPTRPPLFSDDGRWVVLEGSASSYELIVIDPKGAVRRSRLLAMLDAAERKRIPRTSCGDQWLEGYRFEGLSVLVDVQQGPEHPPLAFAVDASTGAITRR